MKKEFLSILATGTVLLGTLTPAVLADSTFSVTGNGAGSQNDVNSRSNNSSTLVQSNTANVTNRVSSNSNTGGNNADENTGGNVTVDTGNAHSITNVSTRANANVADMTNCGCTGGTGSVTVSGNGADSRNNTSLNNTNTSSLFQTNNADVTNDVYSNAQTGNNNANRNTGGDVLVLTGHAANDTTLRTAANANVATMGNGSTGNEGSGTGDLKISGNGFASDNNINLTNNNAAILVQDNNAHITNRVNSDAKTGRNNADENTGGNVTVDTGNALNTTRVDTMANFNSADMGNCGCTLGDFSGKISGNGARSNSHLNLFRNDTMSVFQGGQENGNSADIVNDVSNKEQSGNNNAQRNTGAVSSDPVDVVTGHTGTDTLVRNQTGVNMFGPSVHLPGGTDLNFTFDLNGLLGSLHL